MNNPLIALTILSVLQTKPKYLIGKLHSNVSWSSKQHKYKNLSHKADHKPTGTHKLVF
jgi:hypothetical protein